MISGYDHVFGQVYSKSFTVSGTITNTIREGCRMALSNRNIVLKP